MKKFLIFAIAGYLVACKNSTENQKYSDSEGYLIGQNVSAAQAISVAAMEQDFASGKSDEFTVSGKVVEVCQKKGCWMTIERENSSPLHVTFKDYALFMPFDIAGKEVIIHGKVFRDTTSVEHLRHLAEDANKSAEEIARITEPKIDLAFEADGVLIKGYKPSN